MSGAAAGEMAKVPVPVTLSGGNCALLTVADVVESGAGAAAGDRAIEDRVLG